MRVVNILNEAEFDINSMRQLKSITTTADIRDACSFAFTMLAEYSAFAINNFAQNGNSPLVQSYGERHGAKSSGTVVLTVVSNTFIPAVGSTAIARGTRNMGPDHDLPVPPEYGHPGPQDNDFAPIVTMPLATFIVSDVVGDAVSALIGNPEWAPYVKAMGGVAAAFKQIFEAWKLLQAKREKVGTEDGVVIYQPWLASDDDEEIRRHLRALLHMRRAVERYSQKFFTDAIVGTSGNVAAALVSPKTASIVIALAPAAVMAVMGSNTQDPTAELAWKVLTAVTPTYIGYHCWLPR